MTTQERFPEPSQLLAQHDDQHRASADNRPSLKLTDDDLKLRDAVLSELEVQESLMEGGELYESFMRAMGERKFLHLTG